MGDCFVFRRIAADSRKVELADEDGMELRLELFRAMGFDLGAIHAADQNATGIEADLSRRPDDWLFKAAKTATADVEEDFGKWAGS
jgi:hypothetical protein